MDSVEGHGGTPQTNDRPGDHAPRTQREIDDVLATGAPGWEYLCFAGILFLEKEALEGKYLDHELRVAAPSGERFTDRAALSYLMQAPDELRGLVMALGDVMDPEFQERAFGAPGVAGDADRIKRLAMRWAAQYGALMDWAAGVRGAVHSEKFDNAFELLAQLAGQPIVGCREFFNDLLAQLDRIPAALAAEEPLRIEMTFIPPIEETLVARFAKERARLAAAG